MKLIKLMELIKFMKFSLILTGLLTFTYQGTQAACTYSLVDGSEKVTWTGFKFTEKTGVSGTFDKLTVSHKTADNLKELLESINFKIDTKSINSGNPARDATLQKTVFGFLSVPKSIKGSVVNATKKNIDVKMTLNQKMDTTFSYTAKEGRITALGSIDLAQNGLIKGFNALKEACKILHTGANGASKTWADVQIKLEANYEEKCSKGIIESIKDWFGS